MTKMKEKLNQIKYLMSDFCTMKIQADLMMRFVLIYILKNIMSDAGNKETIQ